MKKYILRMLCMILCLGMIVPLAVGCTSEPADEPSDELSDTDPSDTDTSEPTDEPVTPDEPDVGEIENPSEPDEPTPDLPGDEPIVPEQTSITDFLRLHGRTFVEGKQLKLFWTYSGFSVNIVGTGLEAELTTTNTDPNAIGSLCVYVDGAMKPANTVVVTGNGKYTLVDGLTKGEHTIEVRKKNEAIYGGSATLGFKSLSVTDGGFVSTPPAEKSLKIAFVGDSITSGFGNMVTDGSGERFTTPTQDGTMTYATLTARALGADIEVTSRSGIAFVRNTSSHSSFYDYYKQTAALPGNVAWSVAWDFETNAADIIVINLGTNDSGAKYNGAAVTNDYMTSEAVAFIELVRESNPDAAIIWTYGLMGDGRRAALEAAVKQVNDAGDLDVYYSAMAPQNTGKNGVGVHGHPTVQSHILAAEKLAADIANLFGFEVDESVFAEAQALCNEQYRVLAEGDYEADSYAAYLAALETATTAQDVRDALSLLVKKKVIKPEDKSSEYVVIDTCDEKASWTFTGTVSSGMDTQNQVAGSGCFTATGGNAQYALNFMNTGNSYNVAMPADFADWYLEMWLYVDDPAHMSQSGDVEISQVVDKQEFSYSIPAMNLKAGWNHVQLKLSTARGNPAEMTAIKNIRIFWVNLAGDPLTFKVDDIVLSRGLYAAARTALDALIAEAEAVASPSADLTEALSFAKAATSQRYVDIATERLAEVLK